MLYIFFQTTHPVGFPATGTSPPAARRGTLSDSFTSPPPARAVPGSYPVRYSFGRGPAAWSGKRADKARWGTGRETGQPEPPARGKKIPGIRLHVLNIYIIFAIGKQKQTDSASRHVDARKNCHGKACWIHKNKNHYLTKHFKALWEKSIKASWEDSREK